MAKKKYGAKCPNHGVLLVDCEKNIGICPISGARFTFDAEQAEKTKKLKINSLGEYVQEADWDVKHLDGDDDQ